MHAARLPWRTLRLLKGAAHIDLLLRVSLILPGRATRRRCLAVYFMRLTPSQVYGKPLLGLWILSIK